MIGFKLVKTRKNHTCLSCDKEIKAGEQAYTRSIRRFRSGWKYEVYCTDCADDKPKRKPKRKSKRRPIKVVAPEPSKVAWFNGGDV